MKQIVQRMRLAVAALRGRLTPKDSCSRAHLEDGLVTVKKGRLKALDDSADALKVAVGFIGDSGKWDEYIKVLKANEQG